ncbi:MAG: CinA protein [Pseudomonadota bacterium]|jgi:nicotinamide-nucleotide amidase
MIFASDLRARAFTLLGELRAKGLKIATAESCTGGLVAGLFTEIAGSSDVFERGFVTYSNDAKHELLGVPKTVLDVHGAVSKEVAQAMALGALKHSHADIVIAVTGIAGPGGATETKPIGLVHIAIARKDGAIVHRAFEFGDIGRTEVRLATLDAALALLSELV